MNGWWNEEREDSGLESMNFPEQPDFPVFPEPKEPLFERIKKALGYIFEILGIIFLGLTGIALAMSVSPFLYALVRFTWKIVLKIILPWIEGIGD